MTFKTVKKSDTSKISFLLVEGKPQKVYKEFHSENDLKKELQFIELIDSAIKPEIENNCLCYPYLTPLSSYLTHPLPEPEAIKLLTQCINILSELSLKNIIHKDLKPGNLYLNSTGKLFISDFETAQYNNQNNSNNTSGTPGYMAPEQYCNSTVDWLADQYSLGAIFYKILTGSEAFNEDCRTYEIQNSTTPDPSIDNPKLNTHFSSMVKKLLNPDKEKRFQSIKEIQVDLEKCRQSLVKSEILEDKVVQIIPKKKNDDVAKNSISFFIIFAFFIILIIIISKAT